MKTFIAILTGAVLAVSIAFLAYHLPKEAKILGDSGIPNIMTSATNASSTCSSATSSSVLSTGGARKFALFTNASSSATYVCMSSTCSSGTGAYLSQGSSLKIDNADLYIGPVSCIASSGTTTLSVIYNQ